MFSFLKKKTEPEEFGARVVNQAYKKSNERVGQIDGFTKIAEDDANVAYKNDKGQYKIGIAGSKSLDDALTDAKLFFGKNIADTDRYKKSSDFVKKVTAGTSNPDVELFGHSLSGTIVNELQKQNPTYKSTAYNPYILSSSQLSSQTKNKRTYTDPASLLVATQVENTKLGSFDPIASHSILNFKRGGRIGRKKRRRGF